MWAECTAFSLKGVAPYFSLYTAYVANYELSMSTVDELTGSSKKFKNFVAGAEQMRRCRGLNLGSYLIMPVQRVPRYKMLIEGLLKNSSPDDAHYANLRTAHQAVVKAATIMDESVARIRQAHDVLSVQHRFSSDQGVVLMAPSRQLVRKGTFRVVASGANTAANPRARASSRFSMFSLGVVAGVVGKAKTPSKKSPKPAGSMFNLFDSAEKQGRGGGDKAKAGVDDSSSVSVFLFSDLIVFAEADGEKGGGGVGGENGEDTGGLTLVGRIHLSHPNLRCKVQSVEGSRDERGRSRGKRTSTLQLNNWVLSLVGADPPPERPAEVATPQRRRRRMSLSNMGKALKGTGSRRRMSLSNFGGGGGGSGDTQFKDAVVEFNQRRRRQSVRGSIPERLPVVKDIPTSSGGANRSSAEIAVAAQVQNIMNDDDDDGEGKVPQASGSWETLLASAKASESTATEKELGGWARAILECQASLKEVGSANPDNFGRETSVSFSDGPLANTSFIKGTVTPKAMQMMGMM